MKSATHIDNGFALRPHGLGNGARVCGGCGHPAEARRELPALQD